jgi:hypothetical protein
MTRRAFDRRLHRRRKLLRVGTTAAYSIAGIVLGAIFVAIPVHQAPGKGANPRRVVCYESDGRRTAARGLP